MAAASPEVIAKAIFKRLFVGRYRLAMAQRIYPDPRADIEAAITKVLKRHL